MTNPLLEKYEELHGKKEEPKKKEPKVIGVTNGVLTITEDSLALDQYLSTSSLSSGSSGTASISAGSTYITAATPVTSISSKFPRKFSCYDLDSVNDSFLQTADKIKTNKAQVTSMEVTFDHNASTKTVTFSVQVCDTP